ncbi:MAG: hypothetical protein QM767_11280 [Anaeromyxobacter sp.]
MIPPELRARIRRLFFAEHWKVGTIAAELGVHHETVMRAIEADRFVRPDALVRRSLLDPYARSSPTRWSSIRDCGPRGSSR